MPSIFLPHPLILTSLLLQTRCRPRCRSFGDLARGSCVSRRGVAFAVPRTLGPVEYPSFFSHGIRSRRRTPPRGGSRTETKGVTQTSDMSLIFIVAQYSSASLRFPLASSVRIKPLYVVNI